MSNPNLPAGLENIPPRAPTPGQPEGNKPRTRKGKKNEALTTVMEEEGSNQKGDEENGDNNKSKDDLTDNPGGNNRDNENGDGEGNGGGNGGDDVENSNGRNEGNGQVGNITGIGPDEENMAESVQIEHGHAKWLSNINEALERDMIALVDTQAEMLTGRNLSATNNQPINQVVNNSLPVLANGKAVRYKGTKFNPFYTRPNPQTPAPYVNHTDYANSSYHTQPYYYTPPSYDSQAPFIPNFNNRNRGIGGGRGGGIRPAIGPGSFNKEEAATGNKNPGGNVGGTASGSK
ncbi:uncharacterized protein MELLADRAFT_114705 [Melampsora larici-populina 98AG31]|uniref:Uncharacterized protein n=1 Tax=Melampsora larici-populina (strain 98AG31 / pathotype 3-4-7) TaxID=747676 RepID=F4SEG3_MELLP|nr:uncharacterized protein MELLADRAFT_114705 [Melampsora larici-populina 98AG31]EGF96963.1 hypothetical protein MELLADRAFT_114705 [Melampsora larici-populina 98AG31]